jgi:hypothetical protein
MSFQYLLKVLAIAVLLLWSNQFIGLSQEETFFKISDESRIYLDGEATLRSWNCEATVVIGLLEINISPDILLPLLSYVEQPPASDPNDSKLHHATRKSSFVAAYLEIPIRSLDCGDRFMEKDLRKALKEKYYPLIRYEYLSLKHVTRAPECRGLCLEVEGIFELAGVKKVMVMDFILSKVGTSHLRMRGNHMFRMTEFGIIPPTALFGLLRAYEDVNVIFDISLDIEK